MKKIEDSGLDKKLIQSIKEKIHSGQKAEPVPVIVGDDIYTVELEQKRVKSSGLIYPDCTSARCQEMRQQINEVCKQSGWFPNHPILVCDPQTGECCYCYCR